jgi:putative inorganic carbon (hco3(-)) transporter
MSLLVAGLAVLFALVTIKKLEHGVLLLIALLPTYLLRANFFGFPTTFLELMIITVILVWIVQNRTRVLSKFKLEKRWQLPLLLLLVAATISLFIAPERSAALGVYKAYFIEPILFFFVLIDYLKQKDSLNKIYKSLGLSALAISLFGIFQWATNSGIPTPWDFENRITSIFDYPNAVGLFLGPIIILGALQIYKNKKDRLWITVTFLSSIAIILSKSEAAWIAVAGTLFIAFLINKKTRKITTAALAILILLVAIIPQARNFTSQKLLLQDYSGQVRITIWKESFKMLKDKPLFGAGLSGYKTALTPYHKATHLELFQYPHNIVLNIWTELGLLGLIAIGFLAFQILKKPQFTIVTFVLLEMTIHSLVDVPYFKNDLSVLTWIFLAILIYQYAHRKNTKKIN